MNKRIVLAITAILLLSAFSIFFHVPTVEADGPETQWYTTEVLMTAAECGWAKLDPWLMEMPNGTLWAIATERLYPPNETYIRKSYDDGQTWTPRERWYVPIGGFAGFVMDGNRVWLGMTVMGTGAHDCWSSFDVSYSDDNGDTWSSPLRLHNPNQPTGVPRLFDGTTVIAFESGIVTNSGRTIFAAEFLNYTNYVCGNTPRFASASIVYKNSTESGLDASHWHGSMVNPSFSMETSESSFVQLRNGSLWVFTRNTNDPANPHPYGVWGSFSEDEGLTWCSLYELNNILSIEDAKEAPVHAIRYTTTDNTDRNRILIAWNNHSEPSAVRYKLTVAISYDEVQSFPYSRLIDHDGNRAESSCMTILSNNTIGILYGKDNLASLKFARFNVEWLTQGNDWVNETPPPDDTPPQITSFNDGSNGSFFHTGTPAIKWTLETDAVSYHLQVSTDSTFSNVVIDIYDINEYVFPSHYSENSTHATFILPLEYQIASVNSYYWRVIAYK